MSSNTGYVMTLANSIIGVGILAMPFCFQKCGILLSILLLAISNLVTRLACHYLMKTSLKARRKNLEFVASYVFGPSGKLMAELCVIGYLMGTCITYFVVVGDLGPQIIAKLFDINHSDSLRIFTMVIVTIFCIIPLCLLRNIESISAICISSILFYFCLVLKIFFESESKMLNTYWYENVYWWRPSGITQCLPIFSMALSCQMQIFEIYESLPSQTIDKMNHIVKHGTGICTVVYICVGFFGYVAFYDQQFSGNVLLNLMPSLASDIIQMGFVISVAVSFPLVIFPCRASIYSLLYHRVSASEDKDDEQSKDLDAEYTMSFLQPLLQSHAGTAHYIPEHRFKYITISMVLVALIVGILIPSIELIIGLVGSTIGVAICIMFPASCFIKTNKKNSPERLAAQFLLVFGFFIMILGTYANLGAIDETQSAANIAIDRLPDIHVTHPTENIFMTPSKIDQLKNNMEVRPEKSIDKPLNTNFKSKSSKRKPTKIQRDPTESVREIDLIEKEKMELASKPYIKLQPNNWPNDVKDSPDTKVDSIKSAQSIDDSKSNVANRQFVELPTAVKKLSDSVINNDAIQKEEREIEIDANEQRRNDVKRTQEIVNAVKNQLSKQNEENQQILLQKVNEISEKVNRIANAQIDDHPNLDSNQNVNVNPVANLNQNANQSPSITDTQKADKLDVNEAAAPNVQVKPSIDNDDERKNLPLPPVPVVKLLAESKKSSQMPSQSKDSKPDLRPTDTSLNAPKIETPNSPEKPVEQNEKSPKFEKANEIVGRDLLSNDSKTPSPTTKPLETKSIRDKTDA